MSRRTFTGCAVLIFVCLYGAGLFVYPGKIERDLSARTRERLERDHYVVQKVDFSGRDGAISIAGSAAEAVAAQRSVLAVEGVRVAKVSQALSPELQLDRVGENITLNGHFPSPQLRDAWGSVAEKVFSGMNIHNKILVSDAVTEPSYLLSLAQLMSVIAGTAPEGKLVLRGTEVELSGDVPDVQAGEKLEREARKTLPQGLTLTTHFQAANQARAVAVGRDIRREVESTQLHFKFDSTELTPENLYLVEPLLELVREEPNLHLQIIGHADAIGTDAYNFRLSQRRSEAIAQLFHQQGVKASIETEGRGERQPIADNANPEGRAKNRRVEFKTRTES